MLLMKRRPLAGFTTNQGVVGRDALSAQLRFVPRMERKLARALARNLSEHRQTVRIDRTSVCTAFDCDGEGLPRRDSIGAGSNRPCFVASRRASEAVVRHQSPRSLTVSEGGWHAIRSAGIPPSGCWRRCGKCLAIASGGTGRYTAAVQGYCLRRLP